MRVRRPPSPATVVVKNASGVTTSGLSYFVVSAADLPAQESVALEVVFSLLPDLWQVNFKKDKKELQRRHIDDSRGFSIVRARREIDISKSPYHAKHWTDTWYRGAPGANPYANPRPVTPDGLTTLLQDAWAGRPPRS